MPIGVNAWRRSAPEPAHQPGELVATRTAFGRALEKLGECNPEIVALDGDVKNSTRVAEFASKHPDRFFQPLREHTP